MKIDKTKEFVFDDKTGLVRQQDQVVNVFMPTVETGEFVWQVLDAEGNFDPQATNAAVGADGKAGG